ncbi:hypothetical protein KJ870_02090 [bacterium]|jgi:hypothetical protein|nr:hypothetical protein [bacterium]MBU1433708.1 hypothetical protein [bacterium]MBU1503783.1 hypothetical protein [bacterium]
MLKIYFNDDFEDTDEDEYYDGGDEYTDEEEDLDEDEFYELDDEEEEEDSYCD